MSRPLRIQFPGAVCHVTSRGDKRERIFVDDQDRRSLFEVLEQGQERFDADAQAYCLMGNDYHFVRHTRSANLSSLMSHVKGCTANASTAAMVWWLGLRLKRQSIYHGGHHDV